MTTAPRSHLPLWCLTGAIAACAVVTWLAFASNVVPPPGSGRLAWVVLLLVFVACKLVQVPVEHRSQVQALGVSEVALIVGLGFFAPVWVLVANLLATAAMLVQHRVPLLKLAFNLSLEAWATGVAVVVYGAVAGGAPIVEPAGWLAAYAAAVAACAVSSGCVLLAISISLRRWCISRWTLTFKFAATIVATAIGLVASVVVWVDWRALWLVLGMVATLAVVHWVLVRLRTRYSNLELLYRFTESLSGATEASDVVRRSLEQAQELLRAEDAELVLLVSNGFLVQRLQPSGEVTSELRTSRREQGFEGELLSGGVPVVINRARMAADFAAERPGWRDAVAAPLRVDGQLTGLLIVANRPANGRTFDDDDRKLLETFGEHVAIALRVGELVGQLRADAVEKEFRALHDPLTALPNRMMITQRVDRLLDQASAQSLLAVFFCDLDGFKEVNDALGHHTGDLLLVEIANRLVRSVGHAGMVGRFGGDEFTVVIGGLSSPADAYAAAGRLREVFEEPVVIDKLVLQVGVSIGVALAPTDGTGALALFQHADVAMYVAKERRTGVELYDARFDHSSPRRLRLAGELRHAIDHDELVLYYQPQVDLASGRVVGLEALTRWLHPRYGSVPPDEFIPIAEKSGLIHPLTRWALRTALSDLVGWRTIYPDLGVSVNLSVRNLLDPSLTETVTELVAASGAPPHALTLELVESSVMADPERSLAVLDRLHRMGIKIAIDDFGTGYSSLSYLKRLPADEVKIDKSFVVQMASDPDDSVIVRCTIDLARNLGLGVVAEGVEDLATRGLLAALGCHRIQGYSVSHPLSAADIPALLHRLERDNERVRAAAELASARPKSLQLAV